MRISSFSPCSLDGCYHPFEKTIFNFFAFFLSSIFLEFGQEKTFCTFFFESDDLELSFDFDERKENFLKIILDFIIYIINRMRTVMNPSKSQSRRNLKLTLFGKI
jgi:hypothetical protein